LDVAQSEGVFGQAEVRTDHGEVDLGKEEKLLHGQLADVPIREGLVTADDYLRFFSAFHTVGDSIEQSCLADASIFFVDHHRAFAMSLMPQRDLFATQVDRRFIAVALEAERVVFFDAANRFGVEQLVGILRR